MSKTDIPVYANINYKLIHEEAAKIYEARLKRSRTISARVATLFFVFAFTTAVALPVSTQIKVGMLGFSLFATLQVLKMCLMGLAPIYELIFSDLEHRMLKMQMVIELQALLKQQEATIKSFREDLREDIRGVRDAIHLTM